LQQKTLNSVQALQAVYSGTAHKVNIVKTYKPHAKVKRNCQMLCQSIHWYADVNCSLYWWYQQNSCNLYQQYLHMEAITLLFSTKCFDVQAVLLLHHSSCYVTNSKQI